jgi:hypothetical protein
MRRVQIDFCDLGFNHVKVDQFLCRVLSERFELELCDQPDFLIYSAFGHAHRLHSGVRIFFTGEPLRPDFRECDYSVGPCALDDPRHLPLPFYVTYGQPADLIKRHDDPERILAGKTRFCAFIVSSHNPRKNRNRLKYFERLSRYKRVDAGGRFMNNLGGPVPGGSAGKIAFLRDYKFNIAFENSSLPGYTTEKIYEPMVARCLPIYWGDPLIAQHFNPRSFLNYADFPSEEALIEKIIELDQDEAKYLEYLRHDEPNLFFSHKRILDFFERIFDTKIRPVGQRRKWFTAGRWILVKRHHLLPL